MKKLVLILALLLAAVPAFAVTPQQEKMKACNAEAKAKGLKGDEYKKFRDECLKAKPAAAAPAPAQEAKLSPQEKMKKCNADAKAKNLKGDEYKKFRNECLKAK